MPFIHSNPAFDPKVHGFKFDNHKVPWGLGHRINLGKQLCGGMVYAALDYFFNNIPIPASETPPLVGTELNKYLFERQFDAHKLTVPGLLGGKMLGWLDPDRRFVQSLAGEYDKIRHSILVANRPVPLFLVNADKAIGGHHVLAIGCLSNPSEGGAPPLPKPILKIYDPGYPKDTKDLSVDYKAKKFLLGNYMNLDGFFFDHNYRQKSADKVPRDNAPPAPGPMPPLPPIPPGPLPPAPRLPATAPKLYVVKGGDTLSKLAAIHYGNSSLWPKIYEANRKTIGPNPNLILIGQQLMIPA